MVDFYFISTFKRSTPRFYACKECALIVKSCSLRLFVIQAATLRDKSHYFGLYPYTSLTEHNHKYGISPKKNAFFVLLLWYHGLFVFVSMRLSLSIAQESATTTPKIIFWKKSQNVKLSHRNLAQNEFKRCMRRRLRRLHGINFNFNFSSCITSR